MSQLSASTKGRIAPRVRTAAEMIQKFGWLVAPPLLRIALALPFFRSGLTRWDGVLSISPATLYLFENQFKLHILGGAYAFPAPDSVALIVAIAEVTLPVLHLYWAALAVGIMALGPGPLSLDHLLVRNMQARNNTS